jgi:hypothetical protein
MESLSKEELNRKYREALRIAGIGHLEGYTLQEQQDAQKRAKELKAELQRRELARLEEQLKRQEATEQTAETDTNTYKTDENKSQQQNQPATLKRGEGGKMNGAAATLVRQEAAEGGEIDALKQPEADSAGNPTAQALAAYPKRSALVEYEGNQLKEEEPALKRSRLTPRVLRTNARSKGTNPRARGENPRNRRSLTDFFKEKPKADKVEEIADAGMRMFNLSDRASEKKILAKVWAAKGLGISDDYILWQLDNSAEYGRQPLNLFCVRMNRVFDQIKAGTDPATLHAEWNH